MRQSIFQPHSGLMGNLAEPDWCSDTGLWYAPLPNPTMRSAWVGKARDDAELAPTERNQGSLWALHNGSFHVIIFSQTWSSSHQTPFTPSEAELSWWRPQKRSGYLILQWWIFLGGFFFCPRGDKSMNRVSVSSYYASILASGVPVLSLLVTMVTSCSKKGLCPQCLQGEGGGKWFWARKESGAELSRLSKEAMLTLKLSQPHLIHPVSRLRLRWVQNSSLFILARWCEHVNQASQ